MTFAYPVLIWLSAIAFVATTCLFALDGLRRRRVLQQLGGDRALRSMLLSVSVRRRALKASLFTVGLSLAILSLSRPQVVSETEWRERGIDIAFVMDASRSMLAEDVYPSRYERMVREADDVLDALEAGRISVILFGGATLPLPLTSDRTMAKLLYQRLRPGDMGGGSAVNDAIDQAICALAPETKQACAPIDNARWSMCQASGTGTLSARSPRVRDRGRAILVFTDGAGGTSEELAARVSRARTAGIEVFVVGVGTPSGARVPVQRGGRRVGWERTDDGEVARSVLARTKLLAAANAAGQDRYFEIGQRGYRERLLRALHDLKRGDLGARAVFRRTEVFHWFLIPALLMLLLESFLGEGRRGRP